MSAGAFVKTKYKSNGGLVFGVLVQPETLGLVLATLTNATTADPQGPGLPRALVSGSRRRRGVFTRMVRFRFTTTIPTGYLGGNSILSLPILTQSMWEALDDESEGTYTLNGTAYNVKYVGKSPERIR